MTASKRRFSRTLKHLSADRLRGPLVDALASNKWEGRMFKKPRIEPGRIVMTSGISRLVKNDEHISATVLDELLSRHVAGDWGNVPEEDAQLNDHAVEAGGRILSSYEIQRKGTYHDTVWIITEWDRSVTTILLPEEY